MQAFNHNHVQYVLNVVYKACKHADDAGHNQQKRRVDLGLAEQGSGGLVFPNHVEVCFQTAESQDECDKKAECADESQFADGNVFCVLDDLDKAFGGPVQVEHVQQNGQIIRHEMAEAHGKGYGCKQNQEGNHCHQGGVGQGSCTGHAVVVKE